MPDTPVFLILPGVTANTARLKAVAENAAEHWPEARIEVPDYLCRFRGIRGTGHWLDRWTRLNLGHEEQVFIFAFILGGAALPHAPELLSRAQRIVVLRSRYQEAVPRYLRRRFTALLAPLIFGCAIAGLGKPPFWPRGFAPPCPTLTLVETRPTRLAERLKVRPLSDTDLDITDPREVNVDHDFAYFAPGLMKAVVAWLREPPART